MTFAEFQAGRQWLDNLEAVNPDAFGSKAGYGYLRNELYIDDVTSWNDPARLANGRWYLCIGNVEWQGNDLEELERRLYQWAVREGYEI
jgi:hypothetical protein